MVTEEINAGSKEQDRLKIAKLELLNSHGTHPLARALILVYEKTG